MPLFSALELKIGISNKADEILNEKFLLNDVSIIIPIPFHAT
jgi:hypothetical protein